MAADGVDRLSAAVGLHRADLLQIWSDVKANSARLEACQRHAFEDLTPEKSLGKRWRCVVCGGVADGVAVSWYEQGLRHGGRG